VIRNFQNQKQLRALKNKNYFTLVFILFYFNVHILIACTAVFLKSVTLMEITLYLNALFS